MAISTCNCKSTDTKMSNCKYHGSANPREEDVAPSESFDKIDHSAIDASVKACYDVSSMNDIGTADPIKSEDQPKSDGSVETCSVENESSGNDISATDSIDSEDQPMSDGSVGTWYIVTISFRNDVRTAVSIEFNDQLERDGSAGTIFFVKEWCLAIVLTAYFLKCVDRSESDGSVGTCSLDGVNSMDDTLPADSLESEEQPGNKKNIVNPQDDFEGTLQSFQSQNDFLPSRNPSAGLFWSVISKIKLCNHKLSQERTEYIKTTNDKQFNKRQQLYQVMLEIFFLEEELNFKSKNVPLYWSHFRPNNVDFILAPGLKQFFDSSQVCPLSSTERMRFEWMRFSSYNEQSYSGNGRALVLARNGFYCERSTDRTATRCFACEMSYSTWNDFDNMGRIHGEISPSCPHVNNNDALSGNEPVIPPDTTCSMPVSATASTASSTLLDTSCSMPITCSMPVSTTAATASSTSLNTSGSMPISTTAATASSTSLDTSCSMPITCSMPVSTTAATTSSTSLDTSCSMPITCSMPVSTTAATASSTSLDTSCSMPITCSMPVSTTAATASSTSLATSCSMPVSTTVATASSTSLDTLCSMPVSTKATTASSTSLDTSCSMPVSTTAATASSTWLDTSCSMPVSTTAATTSSTSLDTSCSMPVSTTAATTSSTSLDTLCSMPVNPTDSIASSTLLVTSCSSHVSTIATGSLQKTFQRRSTPNTATCSEPAADSTKQPYTRKKKNKKSRRKSRIIICSGSSGDQSTASATSGEMRELACEQDIESKPKVTSNQEANLSVRKDIPTLFANVQNVDSISTTGGHPAVSSCCGPVTEHGTSAGYQQGADGGLVAHAPSADGEDSKDSTKHPYRREKKKKKPRRKSQIKICSVSSSDVSAAAGTSEVPELVCEQDIDHPNLSARKDIQRLFANLPKNADSIPTNVGQPVVSSSCGIVAENGTSAGYHQGTDCGLAGNAPSAGGKDNKDTKAQPKTEQKRNKRWRRKNRSSASSEAASTTVETSKSHGTARPLNRGLDRSVLSATSFPTVDGSSLEAAGARPKTVSSVNDSTNANSYRRHSLRRDINNGTFRHKSRHGTVPVPVEKLAKLLVNVGELKNDFSKLNKAIKEAPTNDTCSEMQSLKQKYESLEDRQTCKICLDRPVTTTFLPCSHLACCEECAAGLKDCPICREQIKGTMKTYLS